MDAPNPTPDPNMNEAPARSRRRTFTIAGVAGAVAVAGLGVPALAGASDSGATDRRAVMIDVVEDQHGLGGATLNDLADELADLGLEITVSPAGGVEVDPVDPFDDIDEPIDSVGPPGSIDTDDGDDPFAGLTDGEIDALSDDEFFAILEESGWTVDDDGWIMPEGDDGWFDDDPTDDDPTDDDFDEGDFDEGDFDEGDFDETAATFTVDGDDLTRTSGDSTAVVEGEAIWQRFIELIPAGQRSMIVGFEVIAEEGGGGYVYPDDNDPTKWI
ncbi:MAG: hypothetical protein GY929_09930, partial [Actinomycetia bacterium]|nr:hypothetical protein [Actinomycetes bacterium]